MTTDFRDRSDAALVDEVISLDREVSRGASSGELHFRPELQERRIERRDEARAELLRRLERAEAVKRIWTSDPSGQGDVGCQWYALAASLEAL